MQLVNSRCNMGLQIMRLENEDDGSNVVIVSGNGAGENFTLQIKEGDDPNEVFYHPFAYRAFYHGGSGATKNAIVAECDIALAAIDQEEAATKVKQRLFQDTMARLALQKVA